MLYWWFKPLMVTIVIILLIILLIARLLDAIGLKSEIIVALIGIIIGLLALMGMILIGCLLVSVWVEAIPK